MIDFENLSRDYQLVRPSSKLQDVAPGLATSLTDFDWYELSYSGDFAEVIEDIRSGLRQPGINADLVVSTARLARVVIDTKIDQPNKKIGFGEVYSVGQLALGIYTRSAGETELDEFLAKPKISSIQADELVSQQFDISTSHATQIRLVDEAITDLTKKIGDDQQDCVFICLCHGGFIAGASTYIGREWRRDSNGSLFYPVRMSLRKAEDQQPQLTDEELHLLSREARDKPVVIFDEDTSTGATLIKASNFFRDALCTEVEVVTAYGTFNPRRQARKYNIDPKTGDKIAPKPPIFKRFFSAAN